MKYFNVGHEVLCQIFSFLFHLFNVLQEISSILSFNFSYFLSDTTFLVSVAVLFVISSVCFSYRLGLVSKFEGHFSKDVSIIPLNFMVFSLLPLSLLP